MSVFQFKQFSIQQSNSALKVGTDAMLLGALIDASGKTSGLDIGTGTGVLALMVAQKDPQLQIDAVEIDDESLIDCQENFDRSDWTERLTVFKADIRTFQPEKKYDLIFSNPPFYQNSLLSENERTSISKHAAHLSFSELFLQVDLLLEANGNFWVILPGEYDDEVLLLGKQFGLLPHRQIQIEGVPGRHTRSVFSFGKVEHGYSIEKLIVRDADGRYTASYIELTKDYHSKSLR